MITIPEITTIMSRRQPARTAVDGANDFAVGFSRQPLPNGQQFAIRTHTGAAGISAIYASTCFPAKLLPTATNFELSTAEEAGVGPKKITNGVKQQLGIGRLGVENFSLNQSYREGCRV